MTTPTKRFTCLEGHDIEGTLETLQAVAIIERGSMDFLRHRNGKLSLDFEYEGYTDVEWDSQRTVTEDHETIFVCTEGHRVRESQIQVQQT